MKLSFFKVIFISIFGIFAILSSTFAQADPHGGPPSFAHGVKTGWHGQNLPPGFVHGKKTGWHGEGVPPGWHHHHGVYRGWRYHHGVHKGWRHHWHDHDHD